MSLHRVDTLLSPFVTVPLSLGEQLLLTNYNFQNQPKILTKKVKNLDKRNFHSRERFSDWHEAKC